MYKKLVWNHVRKHSHGYTIILDDIAYPKSISCYGTEAKEAERRIAAIGRREDTGVDNVPAGICEDRWKRFPRLCWFGTRWRRGRR
jgi:hypothetical protein